MSPIMCGVDIETTGLKIGDHRIIEIYLGLWQDENLIDHFHTFVDPQRSIDLEAQRVHHITPSDLIGKPIWSDVAPDVVKIISRADILVAHNGRHFDGPFIDHELKRVSAQSPQKPMIDTMDFVWATPNGKKPSLKELCFACGVEYAETTSAGGGAHAADYDVRVMMECVRAARNWGFLEEFLPARESATA